MYTLRDIMPYLVDLGDDLVNSYIIFEDLQRVLGTARGREEIINAIIRSNTVQWERKVEEAKKGEPLSVEELQAVESHIASWLFLTYRTPLESAQQRSQIHLRPEYYNELPRQYRIVFRLSFLCGLSNEDIAEQLQLEHDYAPEPKYGVNEWRHVRGREAENAAWDLLQRMRQVLKEKIRDTYQREREILLEQQRQDAIDYGCPVTIGEISDGIVAKVRHILKEMDVTHLAELRKVRESDVKHGGSEASVSRPSMAKLINVMQQYGVAFLPEPDRYY